MLDSGIKSTEGESPATDHGGWLREAAGYRCVIPALKFEQTPHERSRVELSERRDRDGTPLARIHWEILPSDIDSYRRATLLLCGLFNQGGLARARMRPAYRKSDWSDIIANHAGHQLGTTRMAHAPTAGVVDSDCKVFGLNNLFIAGSSVFAASDYVNPTMNFLALAARLAATLTAGFGEVGQGFRFGHDRPENRYLLEGWSHAEDLGIWSEGRVSRLVLPAAGATRLRLAGWGYREVDLALSVNGIEVFQGRGKDAQRFECEIDGRAECELVFSFPSPQSPASLGESDDQRKLGYFIRSVELSG
ncbi:GMC family oxidoreductase [Mesorhizobium marinum]